MSTRFGGIGIMSKYTVLSDNLANHEKGDTVDAKQLAGANIAALIEGGHIKDNNPPQKKEK